VKKNYIAKYVWKDIWYRGNRPFTLINLIAVGIATAVFVILAGSFMAFEKNTDAMMDSLGLSIEISSKEEQAMPDNIREELHHLENISSLHWWTPTSLLFYDKDGTLRAGLAGRTVELADPLVLSLRDIRSQEPIRFLPKEKMKDAWYDELGIIVPLLILKQLSYLPASADATKPETWKDENFPTHLRMRLRTSDVELPIIGVAAETENGNYLMTKDCYTIFALAWHEIWKTNLLDRKGNPIFPNVTQIKIAHTVPKMKDTHATAYAQTREDIIPIIHHIRSMGLRATSGLEDYIDDYEQQETFFIAAAGGICCIMFFFSGVILFSTFQSLILRKLKEIGILKACGASKFLIYQIFSLEAILVSTLSSLIGVGLGTLFGFKMDSWLQEYLQLPESTWFLLPTYFIVAVFLGGICFCLCVTFFPIRMAVRVDPDVVIRS